jgi:hypothetical protein
MCMPVAEESPLRGRGTAAGEDGCSPECSEGVGAGVKFVRRCDT